MPEEDPRPPPPPQTPPPPNASPRNTANGGRAPSSSNKRGCRGDSRGPAPGRPQEELAQRPGAQGKGECSCPGPAPYPDDPMPPRSPREVCHLLHGGAGDPPAGPRQGHRHHQDHRGGRPGIRVIGRAPDGPTGIGSWRSSGWRRQRKCPRIGTAAGKCGWVQEPPLVFPARPAPASSPRLRGAPAGSRDVVAMQNALQRGSGLGRGRPGPSVNLHPARAPGWCGLLFLSPLCPPRLPLPLRCPGGAQGRFRPGSGISSGCCRPIRGIARVGSCKTAQDLCPRPRGPRGDPCPAAPAP